MIDKKTKWRRCNFVPSPPFGPREKFPIFYPRLTPLSFFYFRDIFFFHDKKYKKNVNRHTKGTVLDYLSLSLSLFNGGGGSGGSGGGGGGGKYNCNKISENK